MNVITQGRQRIDGIHNVFAKMPRMRGRKSHAPDSWHFSDGVKQCGKALFVEWITIGVHVLAEQLNIRVAQIGHLTGFRQHRIRSPAAFLATRIWHNTISTELVTALDDSDVPAVRIASCGEFGLESLVRLTIVQTRYTIVPVLNLHQHLGQVAIGGGTGDQRDVWRLLENPFAFLLGYTAQDCELLALRLQLLTIIKAVKDFLL